MIAICLYGKGCVCGLAGGRTLRIREHPILSFPEREKVAFFFEGRALEGYEGEPIAAALHAAGIRLLRESPVMQRSRGFFCAVGSCSSCLMVVDGVPNVRVCVERVREGIRVERQVGKGELPRQPRPRPIPPDRVGDDRPHENPRPHSQQARRQAGTLEPPLLEPQVMVIGAGPAGMAAALAAADWGADVLLCDSFFELGGQLVKQTHKFFGSRGQYAGTRGVEIARLLGDRVRSHPDVHVLLETQVLGYYPDGVVTMECAARGEASYLKAAPQRLVVATGAQERPLVFPGNDLPGVYGAGAVQTLMNVYGVKPGRRAVMVGAGNIGLIISYQLRQAGVEVAAVVEAAPTIGGYAVHASKIRRLGIPILTSHSVKEAHGSRELEGVTVWKLDENQRGVEGTERRFEADVLCLAVGLSPLAELLWQAGCRMIYVPELGGHVPWRDEDQQTSVPGLYVAGDASGVEEASSAMLSGRIAGLAAAASLGLGPDRAEADGRELIDQARAELEALRRGPPGDKIRRGLARLEEAARAC